MCIEHATIRYNKKEEEKEKRTGNVVVFGRDTKTDVVRKNGHHVDDGHDRTHKLAPIRCREQSVYTEKENTITIKVKLCITAYGVYCMCVNESKNNNNKKKQLKKTGST